METPVAAKTIIKRMMKAANVRSQMKLADIFGITPPAISDAIINDRVPERWFGLIEEKFKVGREELCRPLTPVSASMVQNWGNQVSGQATLTSSPMITANGCDSVAVNQSSADGSVLTLEVTPRERALILRMREFAPPALWRKIEAELQEQEEKYR